MAALTTTYTPAELFAGEPSEIRKAGILVAGQNLAANTVLMQDAAGKYLAHDGVITNDSDFAAVFTVGNKVAGVLIAAVDATGGDTACMVYKDGDFWDDKLVLPATVDGVAITNALTTKLLDTSNVLVTFVDAGEL